MERVVVDDTGHHWRVWEMDAHKIPGARHSHCLIIDGGFTVRRLWSYPPSWRDLDAKTLLAIAPV